MQIQKILAARNADRQTDREADARNPFAKALPEFQTVRSLSQYEISRVLDSRLHLRQTSKSIICSSNI
jgi:hypothetical protein